MSKRTILILLGFAFLFSYRFVFAGLIINEVMYDLKDSDTDREWIELYNNGNTDFIIKGGTSGTDSLRVYEKKSSGAEYNRTFATGTNSAIIPGEYIIVAQNELGFKNDYPNYSGKILIVSAMDLTNTSQTLGLRFGSSGDIWSLVTYNSSQGANGDGNSLQLISGLWKVALPTPGKENETINPPPPSSGGEENNNNSTQNILEPKTKIVEIPKIKTKIMAKTLVFTGIPIEFKANATGYSNEPLFYGKYFWNFGDGDSKETKANDTAKFMHTFFYEGEYTVALEYYQNFYSDNPDAFDKITIKVVPADISISKVGDEKDFFVEISNNTNYNADLSKWILSSNQKSFTLPKNMILEPKKKIILSPKITNFSISDKDTLKLANSQWETVFDYASPIIIEPVKILAKNSIPIKISMAEPAEVEMPASISASLGGPIDNLEATAVKSDTAAGNNLMYEIVFFAFLGISASAAYFVRIRNRKSVLGTAGNDFKIIDE